MARVIDWRDVLSRHRVEFVERGANVRRGELNIQCPFCGSADPSHHMGLSPESGWWACWRNAEHRGKSPVRLLVKLLGVTVKQARELAGLHDDWVDPEGFGSAVARFMGRLVAPVVPVEEERVLHPPAHASPVLDMPGYQADRFLQYLWMRGFNRAGRDPFMLCDQYGLMGAVRGDYAQRVILPYMHEDKMVAYTGRAITDATVRYKDASVDDCIVQVRHTFYNANALHDRSAHTLLVVEGPFDALKLDFYLRPLGARAVAISTNNLSRQQQDVLREAAQNFISVPLMLDLTKPLDAGAAMRMRSGISDIPNMRIVMSSGSDRKIKDAGAMTPSEVLHFYDTIRRT